MNTTSRKKRWLRRLLRTLVLTIGFFIAACLVFDHFVQFRMSDQQLVRLFNDHQIDGKIRYYAAQGRRIRYVDIGSDSLPTLFFLHGSPSSLSIYESYFTDTYFLKHFRMVAVDRPGYGSSGFGRPEPSIKKQADMLWPLLRSIPHSEQPRLMVAGSYGTSIACRILMDHPGAADGMVLIAPSLAPGEEKVFWFTRIIENPLISWFIPRMFQSANTEKLSHEKELRDMLPYWSQINVPVFYLQGAKDRLIYTTNASFARKKLVNVPYLNIKFLEGRPHFFARSDRDSIRATILALYEHLNDPAAPGAKQGYP